MSGWPPVLLVGAALTTCGLGVLGLLGAARSRRELLRMAPIAPLAGMAWIGIVAATAATAGLPFGIPGLIVVTVLTCSAGAYLALRATGPARAPAVEPLRAAGRGRVAEIGLTVGGGLVLLVVCGYALAAYWFKPLVEYDGWAMWGMKAKALALLGGDADVLASPAYSRLHLEYPLLLPALHALPIDVADSFSSNLVVLSCVAVALAALLALWGILRDLARPALLLPGLAAVVAMPAFFFQLGAGYADVPVAMLVAAGVAAAARWLLDGRTSWLALATLFLTASALTKNEGLLFAAAVLAPLAVVAAGRRRAVAVAAGVVALVYAPWRAYVAVHDLGAPDYDLSSSFDPSWVGPRIERIPGAVSGLATRGFDPYEVGFVLALGLAACVLALLAGRLTLGLFASLYAVLSFGGLAWIYVISPSELSSYLSQSASRVVLGTVVGLATLYPLLIEQAADAIRARGEPSEDAGSLNGGGRRATLLRRRASSQ